MASFTEDKLYLYSGHFETKNLSYVLLS